MKPKAFQMLLLIGALTVFGCTSQESKATGKWVCKASGDRMQLAENHTCSIASMGFEYAGKWTLANSDIKIDAGQVVMNGVFDGKTITVEDAAMHNKYIYERVEEKKQP